MWLQERNRGRADTDGRLTATNERLSVGCEHDLPYFDNHVHVPDFRIEYELDGRDHHEDVEVVTAHYRGAHAASVARSGFRCYGGGNRRGRRRPPPPERDLLGPPASGRPSVTATRS